MKFSIWLRWRPCPLGPHEEHEFGRPGGDGFSVARPCNPTLVFSRGTAGSYTSLDGDSAADHGGCPFETRQRDVVLAVQQPVHLRALVLSSRPCGSSISSFPSWLGRVAGYDLLDRLRLRLFKDPLLFQESYISLMVLLTHRINSF